MVVTRYMLFAALKKMFSEECPYLLSRPVLAIVVACRVRDIHEELIALVEVLLRQPYAHGQDGSFM